MTSRFSSIVLAIALVASTVGMLSARASATAVTVGTVNSGGGTSVAGSICQGLQCNNDNGCSTITKRYTEWWPSGQCVAQTGAGSVNVCTQYQMKCRHDIHYYGYFGGCDGQVIDETWHTEPGCYSTVDSGSIAQNNAQTTSASAD